MANEFPQQHVDIARRTDFVGLLKEDRSNAACIILGQTALHLASDDDPRWQIRRIVFLDTGEVSTEYANQGKYNAKWSDRTTYFGACPLNAIPNPDFPVASLPFTTDVVSVLSVPGTEITVLTFVVPAATDRGLVTAGVSTYAEGVTRVKVNGTLVAVGRTSPNLPNIGLKFDPRRPISVGDTIDLTFESVPAIAAATVDGFVAGLDFI